jgi:acyl carrier protein
MKENKVREFVLEYLHDRLQMLGIHEKEIKGNFDFVQSGLLDSMAFVDLVTSMEEHFDREIDFENEVENSGFTNLKALTRLFSK